MASIHRIDETGATARVREMGETNMGSAGILGEFLGFSGPSWPGAQGLTIFLLDSTYAYRLSDYTGDVHKLDFPH